MHGMGSAPPRPRVQAWQERQEPPPSAVTEARHGEGTSKGLHALAQLCQAPLRLCILQQEGLELLELAWVQKGEGGAGERGMGGGTAAPSCPKQRCPLAATAQGPANSLVLLLTSRASAMPSSMNPTTFWKSSSRKWREVSAGAPRDTDTSGL